MHWIGYCHPAQDLVNINYKLNDISDIIATTEEYYDYRRRNIIANAYKGMCSIISVLSGKDDWFETL